MTENKKLKNWVERMVKMCRPDKVVWIDGTEEEKSRLEKEAFSTGELIQLNQEKLPGCVYHRTAINDVARTEHLTYICTKKPEDAGPTNNWMSPHEAYKKATEIFSGSMRSQPSKYLIFAHQRTPS